MVRENAIKFIKDNFGIEEASDEQINNLPKVLLDLTDREERIVRMFYGLDDGRERTLEEIAKEFGVDRELIRETLGRGIKKLRHPTRKRAILGEQ